MDFATAPAAAVAVDDAYLANAVRTAADAAAAAIAYNRQEKNEIEGRKGREMCVLLLCHRLRFLQYCSSL